MEKINPALLTGCFWGPLMILLYLESRQDLMIAPPHQRPPLLWGHICNSPKVYFNYTPLQCGAFTIRA